MKKQEKETEGRQEETCVWRPNNISMTHHTWLNLYQPTLVVRCAFVRQGRLCFCRFWPIFHSNLYRVPYIDLFGSSSSRNWTASEIRAEVPCTVVSCLLCLGSQRAIEVARCERRHVRETINSQWTCWKHTWIHKRLYVPCHFPHIMTFFLVIRHIWKNSSFKWIACGVNQRTDAIFPYVSNIFQYSSNSLLEAKYGQIWAYDQKNWSTLQIRKYSCIWPEKNGHTMSYGCYFLGGNGWYDLLKASGLEIKKHVVRPC